jgi:hypothetical protein
LRSRVRTRVVKGILAANVTGVFEVHLDSGIVRFLPGEAESAKPAASQSAKDWNDRIASHGKPKPVLTRRHLPHAERRARLPPQKIDR